MKLSGTFSLLACLLAFLKCKHENYILSGTSTFNDTIYYANHFLTSDNFYKVGGWVVHSGEIVSPADISNYMTLPVVICSEKFTTAQTGNIGIGFKSQNDCDPVSFKAYLDPVAKKATLWTNSGKTDMSSQRIDSYETGDVISVTITKTKNIVTATFRKTDDTGLSPVPDMNTAKFWISAGAQSNSILKLPWVSGVPKKVDRMLIGNSISHGAFAGRAASRFGESAKMEISAGSSDRTTEILLRVPEIIRIGPKEVCLAIGNDLGFGYLPAIWQTNYKTIVTRLESAGIRVIKLFLLPRYEFDVAPFNTWLASTYPSSSIDINTTLKSDTGIGIKQEYDSVNGVLPNAAGNKEIASTIIKNLMY